MPGRPADQPCVQQRDGRAAPGDSSWPREGPQAGRECAGRLRPLEQAAAAPLEDRSSAHRIRAPADASAEGAPEASTGAGGGASAAAPGTEEG
eukprot:4399292-Alexandrium_andersonii.AAC.1